MLIKNQQNFIWLDFERETFPEHLGPGYGVLLSIKVACSGFAGEIENVWFPREALNRFLADLTVLEAKRRGTAVLKTIQEEFCIEFYATDQAGHVVVRVDLVQEQYSKLCPLRVSTCFDITEYLISIINEFKEVLDEKTR